MISLSALHRRPSRRAPLLAACVLLVVAAGARATDGEADASTSRLFPAKGLVAYFEYDGLARHAEAWQATSASGLIERTPTGAMVDAIAKQLIDRLVQEEPTIKLRGEDVIAFQQDLTRYGFAAAGYADGCSMLVLNGLDRPDTRKRVDQFIQMLNDAGGAKNLPPVEVRGRSLRQAPGPDQGGPANAGEEPAPDPAEAPAPKPESPAPTLSWWVEGSHLVVVAGPAPAPPVKDQKAPAPATHNDILNRIFDTIDAKEPNASSHPGYTAARDEGKEIKEFHPNGLFFVEIADVSKLVLGFDAAGAVGVPVNMPLPVRAARLPAGEARLIPRDPPMPAQVAAVRADAEAQTQQDVPITALNTVSRSDQTPDQPATAPETTPAPATTRDDQALKPEAAEQPQDDPKLQDKNNPKLQDGDDPKAQDKVDPKLQAEVDRTLLAQDEVQFKEQLEQLGVMGAKRFIWRWGFQGKGLLTDVRIEMDAQRKGFLSLVDQPAFRKDALPPIPETIENFVIGSFDPGASFEKLTAALTTLEPETGAVVATVEHAVNDLTGLQLRQDLLAQLGPTWCLYEFPDPARPKDDPSGYVLVVGVRDADAFVKTLNSLAKLANKTLLEWDAGNGEGPAAKKPTDPAILTLEPVPAPDRGYQLASPAGLVYWLDEDVRPAVLVGKSHVVFAVNAERAKLALAAETKAAERWKPLEEVARTFGCLPSELTSLSVAGVGNSAWPLLLHRLPGYLQATANMLGFASGGEATPVSGLVAALGIPASDGIRFRIPSGGPPKVSAIRAHLFPSVLATTVDERGLRWIGREAFPLACVGGAGLTKPSMSFNLSDPKASTFKIGGDFLRILGQ